MSRKLSIHAAVSSIHFRVFDGDVDVDKPTHEMNAKYDHFFAATINDAGQARVEGLTFDIGHEGRCQLTSILKRYGAKVMVWRHKGKEHEFSLDK